MLYASALQIRDTETGVDLPDVLQKVKFSCMEWLHDNSGLFYNVGNSINNFRFCYTLSVTELFG